MPTALDLEPWVNGNKELSAWLYDQVNKRLARDGLIRFNERRDKCGFIHDVEVNSEKLPNASLNNLLKDPFYSPFSGYSILVTYLRETGKQIDHLTTGKPPVHDESTLKARVLARNLDAWKFMWTDQQKTVDKNPQCVLLLKELSQDWEQDLYSPILISRLSFVPWLVIEWGLRLKAVLKKSRARRKRLVLHYSNSRADIKNDPLFTEELKHLSPKDAHRFLASGFKVISKKSERRILNTMGIDKNANPLRQRIWSLILPPFVDYLMFLQSRESSERSRIRACSEASRILNTRYPHLWPDSPRRVKHFSRT